MIFASAVFLFVFFPIVVIGHTIIKNTIIRNVLLVLASLLFYAWGEPVYVLLLLFSIMMNYWFGRWVKGRKVVLVAAVVVNMAMLVVYKYAGFLVEVYNSLPFGDLPVPAITMPIGISFFTFQALSYVIDTYKDKEGRAGDFFDVMLYISLFPQLVAGPIVKYNTVREQLHKREVTVDGLYSGIQRFIIGLSKKMLIANVMAVAADKIFALPVGELDMAAAWVGGISYMLQIYFDFSGYSDMAVGMGRMFGFTFPENFNYPYISTSIREFWKRWHISLTDWFREYLYIPLGGNRKGRNRTLFNRFFVFLCTGIWHGANVTFVVWGIYHGLLTLAETLFEECFKKERAGKDIIINAQKSIVLRVLGRVYTLFAVMVGFIIFRADTFHYGAIVIMKLFSFSTTAIGSMTAASLLSPLFVVTAIVAIVGATPVINVFRAFEGKAALKYVAMAGTLILYVLCIFEVAAGSYNPFIYFRF